MDEPKIWQEYDCPGSKIDFDLYDNGLLFVGQSTHCSGCGGEHKAGQREVIDTTYIDAGHGMRCYGIPRDAEELAQWVEQSRQPVAA